MRILVIGASSGTGRQVVEECIARGHHVTAFARSAQSLPAHPLVTRTTGDALVPADLERAIPGHDAVVVTLGIAEHPLRVRFGLQKTPLAVRSRGTQNTIAAMQRHGITRLIVQTTYGIGASRGRLSWGWALTFALFLAPQIRDSEVQEKIVRESGLAWTLVQPVGLVDRAADAVDAPDAPTEEVFTSADATTKSMQVSRRGVARVLVDVAEDRGGAAIAQSLAVSA